MTGRTGSSHFIVVNLCRRRPAGFTVAAVAGITGAYMFCALAFCRRSIMTGRAGRQWFYVIGRRRPTIGTMTGIAIQIRGDVRGFFAFGKCAVMTTTAGTYHFIVINLCCRGPAVSGMTGITGITGLDMFCTLTFCAGSIMAGRTGTHYFVVIDFCRRCPAVLAVAAITGIRCADVGSTLTFCIGSIMTGRAGRQWFNMIGRRRPAIGAVTDITAPLSRYMA